MSRLSDWQAFSIRVSSEKIAKTLNSPKPIALSLCWEVMVAFAAVIIDHLFDVDSQPVPPSIWIICVLAAVLPLAFFLIHQAVVWLKQLDQIGLGKYDINQWVDLFDNQLCYWVMTANSYAKLLSETTEDTLLSPERQFFYQEGCYYLNQTIDKFLLMAPITDKVFTADSSIQTGIPIHRLITLIEIMKQTQMSLDSSVYKYRNNVGINLQKGINERQSQKMTFFIKALNITFRSHINASLGKELDWDAPSPNIPQ